MRPENAAARGHVCSFPCFRSYASISSRALLSSNQIANRQANLPQLQLHQIVIAPAAPVNAVQTSERTKRNAHALPHAQARRPRQLNKTVGVFPRAQSGHGGVRHRG
jgi:hypothetical protein